MRRLLTVLVTTTLVCVPLTADAVWGGEPDDDRHPGVGAVYYDAEADRVVSIFDIVCSLGYLGPSRDGQHDVVLTAGHCLPPPEENLPPEHVVVSFDNNNDDQVPDGPIPVLAWSYMTGFGHDRGDLRDLGVFLLPAGSVASAFPAAAARAVKLPTAALLDQLKRDQRLKFQRVDAIGYGAIPIWNWWTRCPKRGSPDRV